MIKNKNRTIRILTLGLVITAGIVTAVSYTNVTTQDPRAASYRAELQKLNTLLADPNHTEEFAKIVRNHKFKTANVLAATLHAGSCAEVLTYDKTSLSGIYTLYRSFDVTTPVYVKCQFANGKLIQETVVGDVPPKANIASSDILATNNPVQDRILSGATTRQAIFKGRVYNVAITSDTVTIKGWACEVGVARATTIQVYARGPAGIGQLISVGNADSPTPDDKNEHRGCHTPGANHYFSNVIALPSAQELQGAELFIYAVSIAPDGTANSLLRKIRNIRMSCEHETPDSPGAAPDADLCDGQ